MKGLEEQQGNVPELVRPLFKDTDIEWFEFQRIIPGSSGIYLSTQPDLTTTLISKNVQSTFSRLQNVYEQKREINTLHNIFYFLPKEDNQLANCVLRDFGYRNTFMILEYFDDYIQSFVFSSQHTEDLIRFCFTNFDALVQFKNQFLCQAEKLIVESEKHRVQLVEDNHHHHLKKENNIVWNRENFMQVTKPSHYYVNYKGNAIKITGREFDTLKCLAQGRTNKEAALLLGISPKTLENYQAALKTKFGLTCRNQLIDIYLSSDLVVL